MGSKVDVRELAVDASEELVSCYTVGIVPQVGIGTGVAVEWRGQFMFLTAGHVLDFTKQNPSFFFKPEGSIGRAFLQDNKPGVRFITREDVDIRDVLFDQPRDLAMILLSGDISTEHNVQFLHLDEHCSVPMPGRKVMVIGFPSAIAEEPWPGRLAARRALAYEEMVSPSLGTADFDPDNEFAIAYTYGDDIPPHGVHPGGFSGSGAWYDSGEDSLVWHPQPRLAGIVTTYFPRKRILKGTRIEAIVDVLEAKLS